MEQYNNRDISLDIAKGIGIILVYFAHAINSCFVKDVINSFHVPLFFFLSGLVFNPFKYSFLVFFKKRIKSIIIPLITFTFLGLIIGLPLDLYSIELLSYDFLPANWFLFVLFLTEILCYYPSRQNIFLCLFLSLLFSVIGFYFVPQHFYPHSLNSVFHSSSFYLLGVLFRNYKSILYNISQNKLSLFIAIGFIIFIGLLVNFFGLSMDLKSNKLLGGYLLYITSVLGLFATLIISNILKSVVYLSNFLSYLGKISLTIMGIHLTLFNVVVHFKAFFSSYILYGLVKIFIPLVICCILARLLDTKYFRYSLGKW